MQLMPPPLKWLLLALVLLSAARFHCNSGSLLETSDWQDDFEFDEESTERGPPDRLEPPESSQGTESWEISRKPGRHPALIAAALARELRAKQRSLLNWQDWKDPNHVTTSGYTREKSIPDIEELDPDAGILKPAANNGAEQIFIAPYDSWKGHNSVDHGMSISWVTPEVGRESSPYVLYGESESPYTHKARATGGNYKQGPHYRSGQIYHAKLESLQPSTKYYYQLGEGRGAYQGHFLSTPPRGPSTPYSFAIVGDTGQTPHSVETYEHVVASKPDMVLHTGDLSYADGKSNKWDFWGRIIDRTANAAHVPWLFAPGNHEIERRQDPLFEAFMHRFQMPYDKAGADDNGYYSVEVASAHVIFLNVYEGGLHEGGTQHHWLEQDLEAINRRVTPWLIVVLHVPVYSSNGAHFEEGEHGHADLKGFRVRPTLEPLFYKHQVDFVFAGHVHAYERFHPVYKGTRDECAPVYFTIGDGGNWEGPEPTWKKGRVHGISYDKISAMKEASFGHALLQLVSKDEAVIRWYRNQDGVGVVSDAYTHRKGNTRGRCRRRDAEL